MNMLTRHYLEAYQLTGHTQLTGTIEVNKPFAKILGMEKTSIKSS